MHVHAVNRRHAKLRAHRSRNASATSGGSWSASFPAVEHRGQDEQVPPQCDDDELMRKILARVPDLENEGYQFEAAEASFDLLVMKVAGTYRAQFRPRSLPCECRHVRRRSASGDRGHDQAQRRSDKSSTTWPKGMARSMPWTRPCAKPWRRPFRAWPRCTLSTIKSRDQHRGGDGGRCSRGDRKPRRARRLGDGRRQRERDRSQLDRAGRQRRI